MENFYFFNFILAKGLGFQLKKKRNKYRFLDPPLTLEFFLRFKVQRRVILAGIFQNQMTFFDQIKDSKMVEFYILILKPIS
jgi:hypothetical protein